MSSVSRRSALKALLAASSVAMGRSAWGDEPEPTVNVTGIAQPDLAPFDELMTGFVQKNEVPGVALAVSRNSQIVYARGFGWADVESKTPVQPDTLFRIASISKPVTAVAVLQLAAAGKFQLQNKLFEILPAGDWLPMPHDPRLLEITVLQLLQHTGGWDREISSDPIIKPDEIAKSLNKPLPMGPADVMRYSFTLTLDHDPGVKYAYSNIGYLMLGRLIEHASGKSYEAYVKDEVLKPQGINRMQLGRAWKADLAPGESHYYDRHAQMAPAVNGPELGAEVPIVYGGQNVEGFEAHGGWIASAIDLVKFASAFDDPNHSKLLPASWIETMWARPDGLPGHDKEGKPRATYYACGWQVRPQEGTDKVTAWHNGAIAGTSTLLVRRYDGLNWAVLFNSDEAPDGKRYATLIDPLLQLAANDIKSWPERAVID